MSSKETQNIFLKETSLTDILISLLMENADYSDFINELVDSASKMEDPENE